ncbi:TOBE domain-containing protein [Metabacillus arenae]|uniref:TOBE domain-containing protein n=1 Tax=Metabacillus arenae TaxID=2771434 RepID=A0A926NKE9_9BACI|nr:TOBE domain-containing protein [Metabacillus arenae]MBD1382976.1 TOBE domain-containing protein [Metabacillus arenae]
MKLSARNQLKGTVKEIKEGVVTAEIIIDIGGGNMISSIISKDSIESLGIKNGDEATAVIKATSVMVMA